MGQGISGICCRCGYDGEEETPILRGWLDKVREGVLESARQRARIAI